MSRLLQPVPEQMPYVGRAMAAGRRVASTWRHMPGSAQIEWTLAHEMNEEDRARATEILESTTIGRVMDVAFAMLDLADVTTRRPGNGAKRYTVQNVALGCELVWQMHQQAAERHGTQRREFYAEWLPLFWRVCVDDTSGGYRLSREWLARLDAAVALM